MDDEETLQMTRDILAALLEANPQLDSRHLLTDVDQLQRLVHEMSVYLAHLAQAALLNPFFGAALSPEEQSLPQASLNLAALAHYISCQHQEDEAKTDEQPTEREHLEWPQQPPFRLFE